MYRKTESIKKYLQNRDIDVSELEPPIRLIAYMLTTLFILHYAGEVWKGDNGWKTGDWLINYQGGFVRRGLLGQLMLEISNLGLNLLLVTFLVQSLIYVGITANVLQSFFSKQRKLTELAYLLSPAFIFLFPTYNLQGGFRKEIIAFLAFTLLLKSLSDKQKNAYLIMLMSIMVYSIGVFSHESIGLSLPFFITALHRKQRNTGNNIRNALLAFVFIAISAIGVYLSVQYHGNQTVTDAICQSLVSKGLNPGLCGGGISSLTDSIHDAFRLVATKWPKYLLYLPLFVLSVLPIFMSNWWRSNRLILIGGLVSLLPLFAIAVDWGRWIHIYVFMATMLIISDNEAITRPRYRLTLLTLLAYALVWRLPYCF